MMIGSQQVREARNRELQSLQNENRRLKKMLLKYDQNTIPKQIVVYKAPILEEELRQLRVHLQEIEWGGRFTDDDDCEYDCCPACDAIPDKDEGHAYDCWLKFQIDQLEAIKE